MNTMPDLTKSLASNLTAQIDRRTGYITNIEELREVEYPLLKGTTYLDHAGTTLYAKSLIEAHSKDLTSNLFGNPHSASAASQIATRRIDDTRLQVLKFFNASPDEFDVVFVANATAAIKLIADAFRDSSTGFWYGYHADSHTSLVGVRELATQGSWCFRDDQDVEAWLTGLESSPESEHDCLELFAYPGQSNMTGYRPPYSWCRRVQRVRESTQRRLYTLFDAASLSSTAFLDLSDASVAPDFIALSFYKIFGFPDLGALVVRKPSGHILRQRKYFGGGTVSMVATIDHLWHVKKETSLHDRLEDGTVAFHSIIALQSALAIHARLYQSMENISHHCHFLATTTTKALQSFRRRNGQHVCRLYSVHLLDDGPRRNGPIVAFNILDSHGRFISSAEVEKLAVVKGLQLRTGGLCNPGGIATHLQLTSDEMRTMHAAGQRCGDGQLLPNGKPTAAIRVSFGAMSSQADVTKLLDFVQEYYVEDAPPLPPQDKTLINSTILSTSTFTIESLAVFPIKSCAAFPIPPDRSWEVRDKGLAWDRNWCLVHQGTNAALSQKRHPRMALLKPHIDLERNVLRVTHNIEETPMKELDIDLHEPPARPLPSCGGFSNTISDVCGEQVEIQLYTSSTVSTFFTEALGVPCTLARYPQAGSLRLARPRTQAAPPGESLVDNQRAIMLSNESPILLVSRSSVNRLNEDIKNNGGSGKAVAAGSFRANIVVAEELQGGQSESPYLEDKWQSLHIRDTTFDVLGPCQRCQMVCVDQKNATRRQEPFSTLAKTRRKDGRVWFGMHLCATETRGTEMYIKEGDRVVAS